MSDENTFDEVDELDKEFDEDVEEVKDVVEPFLKEWFGDRCPDFDENCIVCKKWQLYDKLIKKPW